MALTGEEFGRFFEEMKNGTYKCPFCGNEDFSGNVMTHAPGAPPVMSALHVAASQESDAQPTERHVFYSFSCRKCGHTDFFHENQVEAWRASKKGQNTNG